MENIFCHRKDLDKVCRICFDIGTDTCSLFSMKDGSSIYEKLVKDAKLSVHIDDGGPASICSHCLDELNVFTKFLDKCQRANEIFLQFKEKLKDTSYVDISTNYSTNDAEANSRQCSQDSIHTKDLSSSEGETRVEGSEKFKGVVTKPASHTCQICGKVFTRKFNYTLHVERHGGRCEWACGACGAAAASRALALRHCGGGRARKPCPAPGCEKSFTSITNLNTHIRKHTGERPYICGECGKTFGSKNTLSDHMRIHTGVKPYMCSECGARFATNKLAAHMRSHAARAYSCPACPRRLACARSLRLHARTHAPPARAHACTACPARYAHKQSLNKHLRQRHGPGPGPDPMILHRQLVQRRTVATGKSQQETRRSLF